MALVASLWQGLSISHLNLGESILEALGAESVSESHLCREEDGVVLVLPQKEVAWDCIQAACFGS